MVGTAGAEEPTDMGPGQSKLFCGHCGAARSPIAARFCADCGTSFDPPRIQQVNASGQAGEPDDGTPSRSEPRGATADQPPTDWTDSHEPKKVGKKWPLAITAVAVVIIAVIWVVNSQGSNSQDSRSTAADAAQAFVTAFNAGNNLTAHSYVCGAGAYQITGFFNQNPALGPDILTVLSVDDGPHNPLNGNTWTIIGVYQPLYNTSIHLNIQIGQAPNGQWLFCDSRPLQSDER